MSNSEMKNEVVIGREEGGPWVVAVVEDGVTTTKEFQVLDFARSYAEGQSFRLGIPTQEQLDVHDSGNACRH